MGMKETKEIMTKVDIERRKMKLICCGQWKTATKSCTAALKILGYNPSDYMDTMTHLSPIWLKYFDGKATISEVINEYEKHGFDSCQDIPSNYHWKELYDELGPDTKVILTVRDNTDRWWNSYFNFFKQETERSGLGARPVIGDINMGNLFTVMMSWGLLGPEMYRFHKLNWLTLEKFSDTAVFMHSWSVKKIINAIKESESEMKRKYEEHNDKVQMTIPSENLLVWNLKDGWGPVCKFLNKPVPDMPIPRENVTGDLKWAQENLYESDIFQRSSIYFLLSVIVFITIIFLIIFLPIHLTLDNPDELTNSTEPRTL